MKKLILLLLMALASGGSLAQNTTATKPTAPRLTIRTISGMVKDSAGLAVAGATISLKSNRDSLFAVTDINGLFVFKNVRSASFTLTVSSIGFQKQVKIIKGNASLRTITLDPIVLKTQSAMLQGVTINGVASITYKNDTVLYPASVYKVRENATPDELLKKMQGMEVSSDGTITHQGQEITKVRVNGKDYFGGRAAQAIQNLPADVVEKIQIVDDYGDQASKTGVKGSDPVKVLNIITTPDIKNESYKKLDEKGFVNPLESPLSTFSVDVDAASYSNVRRFINEGQLPPADAVRIEEMINYFSYHLPEPKNDEPVAIQTELSSAPWNSRHRLLRIALKAKTVDPEKIPASNLVFLIDVSGSMNEPNKLPLVKAAMKMLVEQLRPQDKVAIVTYAGQAGILLPSTPGSEKEKISNAIEQLNAGGSTNGGEGIKMAYITAVANMVKGNNRIIMATDGDFNVGPSSDESMEKLITRERGTGVDLSIMGFGMGNLKDSKMETLADKGNGNYFYIDNITEAHKALVDEFSSTLFTVAKDVKLQIEFNPAKVQAYRLLGYEDRMLAKEDFNNDKKDAGDMGAGHAVTALYEIIPAGIKDNFVGSVDDLKYQKNDKAPASPSNEMLTVKFRYKTPGTDNSQLSTATVDDKPIALNSTSADFRFAASVAEFGLLLRDSEFKQGATFEQVISLAKAAKADDPDGYRSEFIRLAQSTKLLAKNQLVGVVY